MAVHQVCHIEWNVTDFAKAQKFYEGLFAWKFQQFGDDMLIFGTGTEHIGGFTKVATVTPGTSPSVWIEVEDIEKQTGAAAGLGGLVEVSKRPVPGVGWSAVLRDSDGNRVGIVQFDRSAI